MKVYLNLKKGAVGGPQVWTSRFCTLLEQRGFQIVDDLSSDWLAGLFVIDSEGMERALQPGRVVGYRVANGYLPLWFQTMQRPMKPEHHTTNATIARALEIADIIIYQSSWAKQILDSTLFHRQDRFAIIHNGVDLQRFKKFGAVQPDIPVIGTVGLLRYRYRLETFFEASRRIQTPHQLLIVGSLDDECSQVLRRYQADPIIGPRISYQAHLPPEQLAAFYQQMSLLIHPVCGDVCPNVVVEALACGVPVVAPRYGGTAELIGEAGVIFDCAPWQYNDQFIDSMAAAASQAIEKATRLSLLARRRAEEKFDIQVIVDQYLQALALPQHAPSPSPVFQVARPPKIREKIAQWVIRPRYLGATAIRKAGQLQRRIFPPPPNPKPRIAFTLYDFHVGGIENWLYRLAGALKTQFDFYFLATKVPETLPKFQQVGSFAYLPNPLVMTRFLQKHNIDIVQVHNERWPIDAALAAGVRHVIERTDGTRSCNRVPKHGLSLVIASAQATIPLIAQHFPQQNIRLIYNGIDLDEVDATPCKRPWAEDDFVIGRTSRFGRGKNLGMLIEAAQLLALRFPNIKVVFIGGDSKMPGAEPVEAELHQQAAPLGDMVEFLGVQENTLPWIKGFDVGTCVSNPENEGIPNSLIEAMACCKPVISTDVDQVSELVTDQQNGFLIPPGDATALAAAIQKLLENPSLRQQLGAAARRTIEEQFSLQRAADQYAALYRQLLEGVFK